MEWLGRGEKRKYGAIRQEEIVKKVYNHQRALKLDSNKGNISMPHSFYPHMNKYIEVIDFGSKIDADNYVRSGWELIDTHAEPFPGRDQTILIYRVGWRRDAGEPVEPPKVGGPPELDTGPSAN